MFLAGFLFLQGVLASSNEVNEKVGELTTSQLHTEEIIQQIPIKAVAVENQFYSLSIQYVDGQPLAANEVFPFNFIEISEIYSPLPLLFSVLLDVKGMYFQLLFPSIPFSDL